MIHDTTDISKGLDFWNWFKANNARFLFLNEVDEQEKEKMMDDLLEQLHGYCKYLFFEIGSHPKDSVCELIITAEGNTDYFDKVETLVDLAPEIKEWQFLKYRQPHGKGFSVDYGGRVFDPEKTIFILLYSEEKPESIGIQVCYPDYTEEERQMFMHGTFIMVDTLIGERSAALDLDYLDVVKTPDDLIDSDYPLLSSLPELITDRKVNKYPVDNFAVFEHTDENGYLTFITANLSYKNFSYRNEFPWFTRVVINTKSYNENGHPDDEEAEILNAFEDLIEKSLKEVTATQYIGRTTLYKKRELLYYVKDLRAAEYMLNSIRDDESTVRQFNFSIDADPEWQKVEYIFQKTAVTPEE